MKSKNPQKALDARKKLFIQLVGVKQSDNMTRTYMAMKQSAMLNVDEEAKHSTAKAHL